jgi:hypothetical protein
MSNHRSFSRFVLISLALLGLSVSSVNAAFVSAKDILTSNPAAVDGLYWIDPDGTGGVAPYEIYADMSTAGGGWSLGVHSLSGSNSSTTDMVSNTGTVGLSTGHTRDLTHLAIDRDAEIRHRLVDFDGTVLFDGYYTGNYHGAMGNLGDWTTLEGTSNIMSYHFGRSWSTVANDVDSHGGNCASINGGIPWYYGACWTTIPVQPYYAASGPSGYAYTDLIKSYSIYARELQTPSLSPVPVPAAVWLFGTALIGFVGMSRRRKVA